MADYTGYVGYVKLRDPKITEGVIGARQSAQMLVTFDNAIHNMLVQIEPELGAIDFDIPIKVREGSWEALIPNTIAEWLITASGASVTTAAVQLTKNSVGDKDFVQATRSAVGLFQGVIRIAKHVGGLGKRGVGIGVKFTDNNDTVEIPNDDGIVITTTRKELEAYMRTPQKLLQAVVEFLGQESSFAVGAVAGDGSASEEAITYADRELFDGENETETDEVVLSELKHGDYVELVGDMTRGNTITNTIGFKYGGHIVTCQPAGAPITAFREAFFKSCTIGGHVSRLSDDGIANAKRPKIIFDKLIPIETESLQATLL